MNRILLTAAVAGVLLAVAGSALAAGPPRTPPRAGLAAGPGYGLMAGGAVVDAAAAYIGIGEAELIAARHDGKSLAQIATDHGKTAAGLQAAVTAAFKANLDKAVSAGRLTQAQAAQALQRFQAQVPTMLTRTTAGPAGGGMGLGMGPCRS